MMNDAPKHPRGSEWRKWDLHVHTPRSVLEQHFGGDFEKYAKALFNAAHDNDVHVIGVTDYYSIKGYRELVAIRADEAQLRKLLDPEVAKFASGITLLPNIELRTDPFVTVMKSDGSSSKSSKVNLHVIFSEDVNPDHIEHLFLNRLSFTYSARPGGEDKHTVTEASIEEYGRHLQTLNPKWKKENPLWTGMNQLYIAYDQILDALGANKSVFDGMSVIVAVPDEDLGKVPPDSGASTTRLRHLQRAHAFFGRDNKTRLLHLGKGELDEDQVKTTFGGVKPTFTGSDAHDVESLFKRPNGDVTWIKADPTFRGLRQVLHEPHDRVFIGRIPPERERQESDPTNVMVQVNFERLKSAPEGHNWFSGTVSLNPGLVAVIGRKGSGKSALADVLALLGQTDRRSFEFLAPNRFLQGKPPLGSHFTAELTWASSGSSGVKQLHDPVDPNSIPSVTYLPQRHISTICDDVGQDASQEFEQELQRVIFSHVPQEDRDDAATLEEYLSKATKALYGQIASQRDVLNDLIIRIDKLEERLSSDAINRMDEEEARVKRAFNALEEDPPKLPAGAEASGSQDKDQKIQKELIAAKKQLSEREAELEHAGAETKKANSQAKAAKRIQQVFTTARATVQSWKDNIKTDAEALGLNVESLIDLRLDDAVVRGKLENAEVGAKNYREQLDEQLHGSAAQRAAEQREVIAKLRDQLDAPERLYQEYLGKQKEWERQKTTLMGSATKPNTLKWFEAQRKARKMLPSEIKELEGKRDAAIGAIFSALEEIRDVYRKLYGPVEDATKRAQGAQHMPEFRAEIVAPTFIDDFMDFINAGAIGSFQGVDSGRERLRKLLKETRFDKEGDALGFVRRMRQELEEDSRDPDNATPIPMERQLRKGKTKAKLLQYLYGLQYLEHRFSLKWNGKDIEQLSPGERGTLLLLFYLTIDRDSRPLIIDQPEENLDNQTVYDELVHAIKEAKKRRQIIIVTHNPNLAVVCDAEQIILAEMSKEDGNRVKYTTGSIEDPLINEKVVEVLEGTRPC